MRPLALAAVVLLAGFANPVPGPSAALIKETAGRIAEPAKSCVSAFPSESLRVIDSMTLAYGTGSTVYINHLPGPCPALSQFNTLIVELQGSQYCRGDRVRGNEPGSIIPGPSCNLGDWVPYRRQ
jgi:hypothetical protein